MASALTLPWRRQTLRRRFASLCLAAPLQALIVNEGVDHRDKQGDEENDKTGGNPSLDDYGKEAQQTSRDHAFRGQAVGGKPNAFIALWR